MTFPFLSPGVPNYVIYAMAGAVVGHEVSHAFDDQGGRYDELGNLNNWWDLMTAKKFSEKTRCFIEQYGNVSIPEVGVNLNGQLTVGENIADNGGIKTAYMGDGANSVYSTNTTLINSAFYPSNAQAYKKWLLTTSLGQPALPGLQNFTNDQLFFLAYANNWCSIVRPLFYRQLIMTDVHSPSKYRVLIPLRNFHQFSLAYKCPPNSSMNPLEKCSIW